MRHRKLLLALDGYSAHCSYKVLKPFKETFMVFVGLSARTRHSNQQLDFSVFSPYKTEIHNALNRRTLVVKDETKDEIYMVCELLSNAENHALFFQNIIRGFSSCGLWVSRASGVNSGVTMATDITIFERAQSQSAATTTYHEIMKSFCTSVNLLHSDGKILVSGTLNTKTLEIID